MQKQNQLPPVVNINGTFFRECSKEKEVVTFWEMKRNVPVEINHTLPVIKVATGKGWKRASPSQSARFRKQS